MDKNGQETIHRSLMHLWNTFGRSILHQKKKKKLICKNDMTIVEPSLFHLMQTSIIYI